MNFWIILSDYRLNPQFGIFNIPTQLKTDFHEKLKYTRGMLKTLETIKGTHGPYIITIWLTVVDDDAVAEMHEPRKLTKSSVGSRLIVIGRHCVLSTVMKNWAIYGHKNWATPIHFMSLLCPFSPFLGILLLLFLWYVITCLVNHFFCFKFFCFWQWS